MFGYDILIDILRGGERIGEHVFRFEPMPRAWEVRQIARNFEHPDASSSCILLVRPEGYESVDLKMRRGDERVSLQLSAPADGEIIIESGAGIIREAAGARPFLLDGPGPIFDCINAILVLGICDGEHWEMPVYRLDPEGGCLLRRTQRFSRRGRVITIAKGADPLGDSRLILDDENMVVAMCHAGGYLYRFGGEG